MLFVRGEETTSTNEGDEKTDTEKNNETGGTTGNKEQNEQTETEKTDGEEGDKKTESEKNDGESEDEMKEDEENKGDGNGETNKGEDESKGDEQSTDDKGDGDDDVVVSENNEQETEEEVGNQAAGGQDQTTVEFKEFSMDSYVQDFRVEFTFYRHADQSVRLKCVVAASDKYFSEGNYPTLYLVKGFPSCKNLPTTGTVQVKELAVLEKHGKWLLRTARYHHSNEGGARLAKTFYCGNDAAFSDCPRVGV